MSLLETANEKVVVPPNCQCFPSLFVLVLVLVLVLDQLTQTRQQSIDRHPRSRAARATQAQNAQLHRLAAVATKTRRSAVQFFLGTGLSTVIASGLMPGATSNTMPDDSNLEYLPPTVGSLPSAISESPSATGMIMAR